MTLPRFTRRLVGLAVLTPAFVVVGACGEQQNQPGSTGGNGSGGESLATGGTKDDSGFDLPVGSGGSGDGAGGAKDDTSVIANCARTEVTAVDTTTSLPADIIILVDTSPSMLEETKFVRENLNAFSQQIIESGVDARVIMIAEPIPADVPADMRDTVPGICIDPPLGSGSCPDDTLLPNYVHLPQTVRSTDSFDVLMRAAAEWKEHIRPDSVIFLVVISDDTARYPSAIIYGDPPLWEDIDFMSNRFHSDFTAVTGALHPWSMNGVYPFTACTDAERAGETYAQLVEMTNGVAGDLCEQDFQPVFDRLGARVVDDAVALSCEWELPDPVDGQTFSTELVQVTRTSAGGVTQELLQVPSQPDCSAGSWYFDDPSNPSRILACPETCDAISDDTEGRIDVVFGCEIVEGCSASGAGSLATVPAQGDAGGDDEGSEPVACEWPLPEADTGSSVDLESLNVRYVTRNGFGVLVGQVEDAEACASVNQGWYYDEPGEPTSIVACSSTCETLQVADVAEIEALFGCETKAAVVK